jgi:hypothetical protein
LTYSNNIFRIEAKKLPVGGLASMPLAVITEDTALMIDNEVA